MIRDLTESLEAFLGQPGLPPELAAASIRFERPTDPYVLTETTVNLFLFDIREDLELRNNEFVSRRSGNVVIQERPRPRITCTYLVTAWPVDGLDLPKQEHRLLSQLLVLFLGTPVLPAAFLTGSLVGQEPDLPLLIAQPGPEKNPAEFWTAVGNHLKASLFLSVTISLSVTPDATFPQVISSGIQINAEPLFFRIGGIVRDAASLPVSMAAVELLNAGRSTITNANGEWTLPAIAPGPYSLRATAGPLTRTLPITVPAPLGSNYDLQLV
jgi:hypothetical protein